MKYKLDKQINEVAEGVHNKGRTSKSGFVGVVIRPLFYLCGHVPLINNDKYECVYTARDKTVVHQIPARQTRRPRAEPITRQYVCKFSVPCVLFLSLFPSLFRSLLFFFFFFIAKFISVVRLFGVTRWRKQQREISYIRYIRCKRKNSLVKFLVSFVARNKYGGTRSRGSDNFVVSTLPGQEKLGSDNINANSYLPHVCGTLWASIILCPVCPKNQSNRYFYAQSII